MHPISVLITGSYADSKHRIRPTGAIYKFRLPLQSQCFIASAK
jgi:hypothetical protein